MPQIKIIFLNEPVFKGQSLSPALTELMEEWPVCNYIVMVGMMKRYLGHWASFDSMGLLPDT